MCNCTVIMLAHSHKCGVNERIRRAMKNIVISAVKLYCDEPDGAAALYAAITSVIVTHAVVLKALMIVGPVLVGAGVVCWLDDGSNSVLYAGIGWVGAILGLWLINKFVALVAQ